MGSKNSGDSRSCVVRICDQGDIIEIVNQRTDHWRDPARVPECSQHPHEDRSSKSDLGMLAVESDRPDFQTAIKVRKFGCVTNLKLRWTVCVCALPQLVNSGAEEALSPRMGDETSPYVSVSIPRAQFPKL